MTPQQCFANSLPNGRNLKELDIVWHTPSLGGGAHTAIWIVATTCVTIIVIAIAIAIAAKQ